MTVTFNPRGGLILVYADIEGPAGVVVARLALDTASTLTTISLATLTAAGYSTAGTLPQSVTSASGSVSAPQVRITRIKALDQERTNLDVLGYTLPNSSAEGLLGLDFLRGMKLEIDFRLGEINLG